MEMPYPLANEKKSKRNGFIFKIINEPIIKSLECKFNTSLAEKIMKRICANKLGSLIVNSLVPNNFILNSINQVLRIWLLAS